MAVDAAAVALETGPDAAGPDATGPADPCATACVCAICLTVPILPGASDETAPERLRVGPALVSVPLGTELDRPDPPPRSLA
ncbi:hypothetical protein [Chthonobacter rhizosphaerae]|uniref:hypothetical protein n=1 Tax=Chthonobacter rhizosphaerae TaxID=2735553 RepID=UPI0015EE7204|nr:hypothetical protein [Chthonobacter rhizosphaerae]